MIYAMDEKPTSVRAGVGDFLAFTFGTTIAMWSIGYFLRLPGLEVPSSLVLAVVLLAMFLGFVLFEGMTSRGIVGGAILGLLVGLVNLLVLLGLLSPAQGAKVPSPIIWVPGSLVCGALIGILGWAVGRYAFGSLRRLWNWQAGFAFVVWFSVLILLIVGGLVTSYGAGLAVVDWPNTFGYNIFLYPLSRMSGGIYYEHSHRLFGALVGLSILVFAVYIHFSELGKLLRWLSSLAAFMVILQGIFGGLRVTGSFTLSTSPEMMSPSSFLAVVHGILGQLLFALFGLIWLLCSGSFFFSVAQRAKGVPREKYLSIFLLLILLIQLGLGAVLRHYSIWLYPHMFTGFAVFILSALLGLRLWARQGGVTIIARAGFLLVWLALLQSILGLESWVLSGPLRSTPAWAGLSNLEVLVTTSHQVTGAIILALSAMLVSLLHVSSGAIGKVSSSSDVEERSLAEKGQRSLP